jgi:hypothetical protein
MHGGYLPSVVAMISIDMVQQIADLSMQQIQSLGNIRVDMPAEEHVLIEAVNPKDIFALDKLKIARAIKPDVRYAKDNLIKMPLPRPIPYRVKCAGHIFPIECLPQSLRYLEPRQVIEARGQIFDLA